MLRVSSQNANIRGLFQNSVRLPRLDILYRLRAYSHHKKNVTCFVLYNRVMAFSDPAQNVARFGITEGMVIADFGSGSGYYTLAASEAVGASGKVYAVEVQKELLKKVKDLSSTAFRSNIETIWGNIEQSGGSKLADASVDAVIIANVIFQTEDKEAVFAEAYRVLKPKGQLFIVEWKESFGGLGPYLGDVIAPDIMRSLAEHSGFTYVRSVPAGEHHYGLVLRK